MRDIARLLVIAGILAGGFESSAEADVSFTLIANEFQGGLTWLTPDIRPALADDGMVAFAGSHDVLPETSHIFVGSGLLLQAIECCSKTAITPTSVEINSRGQVVIATTRVVNHNRFTGVYGATLPSTRFAPFVETLASSFSIERDNYVHGNVALAPNGLIAFSTIVNGHGAIYRGPFGPDKLNVLHSGSNYYYNTGCVGVNAGGRVAVQTEYSDPITHLSRGILLFETPEQTMDTLTTAVERLRVSESYQFAMNGSNQIAFVTPRGLSMSFYDPPDDPFGSVVEVVTRPPGVYVSTPTPFGTPKHPVPIATEADGYSWFGQVDINDAGQVVFEAKAGGIAGIFKGPDPVADKLVQAGDMHDGIQFVSVTLGEINNSGSVSVLTSNTYYPGGQVWRIDGAFDP